MVATDKNSDIAFMNPAAEALTGHTFEEVVGKRISELIVLEDEGSRTPMTCPVALTFERNEGVTYDRDTLLVTKGDKRVPVSLNTAFIRDERDEISGVAIVFRDITARLKAYELTEREARAEVFSLLASALPVFAAGVPPQARTMLLHSFADRFDRNMRERFDVHLGRMRASPYSRVARNIDDDLAIDAFFSWLDGLYDGLGSHAKRTGGPDELAVQISRCPWLDEAKGSPIFCNICRAMVTRTFTWTKLKGEVSVTGTIAQGAKSCMFDIRLQGK